MEMLRLAACLEEHYPRSIANAVLAVALMARIHQSYRFIMSFNAGLIGLGVAGILPPATSALLHNASTLTVSLRSMTDLLES